MLLLILSILTFVHSSMQDTLRTVSHLGYFPLDTINPPHATFSHYIGPIQVEEGLLYFMIFIPLQPRLLQLINHIEILGQILPTQNVDTICQFLELRDQVPLSQVSLDFRRILYHYLRSIKEIAEMNHFLWHTITKVKMSLDSGYQHDIEFNFDFNKSCTQTIRTYREFLEDVFYEELIISGKILTPRDGFVTLGKSLEIRVDSTVPIKIGIYKDMNTPTEMKFNGKIALVFPLHGNHVQICDNDREETFQFDPEDDLVIEFDEKFEEDHQVSLKWNLKENL